MLLPNERNQAIDLLVNNYSHTVSYGSNEMLNLLRNGHKGFASYSDHELLRAVQTLARKTDKWEVKNFISTIAADKFVLE